MNLIEQILELKNKRADLMSQVQEIDTLLTDIASAVTGENPATGPAEAPRIVKKRGRKAKGAPEVENLPQCDLVPQG